MHRLVILLILFALLLPSAFAQQEDENLDLRDILLQLAENDRVYRNEIEKLRAKPGFNEREIRSLMEEQQALDAENQRLLESIVAQHGWPGKSMVGETGAEAALSILEHADHSYQKTYLPRLKQAAQHGELPPDQIARLEDRVRMREGLPQLYGTLVRTEGSNGETHLYPIENPAEVNARRAAVGLPPIEEMLVEKGIDWRPPRTAEPVQDTLRMPEFVPPPEPVELFDVVPVDTSVTADTSAVPDTTKATNW